MLSNINNSFNTFSSSCVKTEMEHDDKMFIDINQSIIKQESISPSLSTCEVKDKIMQCQSCSYNSVDFGKLKSHKFIQHPTEAAVITNYFGKADLNVQDIIFFCIKETCSFSTALCNVYEQHLLHCCSIHQTMTRTETERLKSTITFVLNFHNKFGLDSVSGFQDFLSAFNKIYTSLADQDKLSDYLEYNGSSSSVRLCNSTLISNVKSCLGFDDAKRSSDYSFSSAPDTFMLLDTQNTDFSTGSEVGKTPLMYVATQDKRNELLMKTHLHIRKIPSSSKVDIINIESSTDHLLSNIVEVDNDIARRPLSDDNDSFLEEMRKDNIKDEMNFDSKYNRCGEIFSEENDLLMNPGLKYIDDGTEAVSNGLKPNVKDLSNMLSNINDSFNTFNSSCVETKKEHDDKMFIDFNQSTKKQETLSHSLSNCEVKKYEILHCQSCSYKDVDIDKLMSHKFTQHPTEAAVIVNYFGETNLDIHDIRFFCIKETCSFSTTLCNVYEQHLLHCCSIHQTMTRIETERLKSTTTFLLDFHNKHGLDAISGFLDVASSFNNIYTSNTDQDEINEDLEYSRPSSMLSVSNSALLSDAKSCLRSDDKKRIPLCSFSSVPGNVLLVNTQNTDLSSEVDQTNTECMAKPEKHNELLINTDPYITKYSQSNNTEIISIESSVDHLDSNNVELEIDIAGKPLYDNNNFYLEGMRKVIIKDEVNFDAQCNKCDKILAQESNNLMHTGAHDKEKGGSKCNDCTENFDGDNTPFLLRTNGKLKEERKFKCTQCGKGFSRKSSLTSHAKLHTGEKPYACNECDISFNVKSNLLRHIKIHTQEKPFICNECSKSFRSKDHLIVHMRIHTGEKRLSCKECGKGFHGNSSLRGHMRLHTGEKPFICIECGKCFRVKSNLTVHMNVHSGEKPFMCSECCKGFRLKSILTEHMRVHTGEKPFKCSECGKCCSQKGSLTKHMRVHTIEKLFICNECGKGFNQKGRLIVHMRVHTGEKPFMCNECGKSFSLKYKLTVHMRVHTGEKSHMCNECGKGFCLKSRLTAHMRLHTRDKSFKCSECGKDYDEKRKLAVHKSLHTGEKPFYCNECGKGFSYRSRLTEHLGVHTEDKPFICNDCGKGFSLKKRLTEHMRRHTGKKPFNCNECGKSFCDKSTLIKHMRLHTRESVLNVVKMLV